MNQLIYRGYKIDYKITGKGITIVFLHGFLEDLGIWDDFTTGLNDSFKIMVIDLPGFGNSDVIGSIHSMELMADAVKEVISKEKIEDCFMVGHSMGGYVGLEFIRKYSDYCKGLVLLNSQAAADDEAGKKNRDRTIEIVQKNHSRFISSFIPTLFKESNIKLYRKKIDALTRTSLLTSDKGIIAALKGMKERRDSLELLKNTDVPVLFIAGKHDSKIPLVKIKEQIILPKVSESLILDDAGHMAFIETRDLCLKTIKNFAQKHSY